jgi:aryl-alcohol dehydrogenase-like predicted oxidoreductase
MAGTAAICGPSASPPRATEREGMAFIPWFPIADGELAGPGGPLEAAAAASGATPAQVALAWLLRRPPAMPPIPGSASVAHLEETSPRLRSGFPAPEPSPAAARSPPYRRSGMRKNAQLSGSRAEAGSV